VLVFYLALTLPASTWLLDIDCVPELSENRTPTHAPVRPSTFAEWRVFPRAFESYWNDAFGLRRLLIWGNGLAHYLVGVSPTTQVLIGGKSWLFFASEGVVERYRGLKILSNEELEDWKSALEVRQQSLARTGGHYLFVVAPDKDSVYPEFFPAQFNRIGPTPFDLLLAYLHDHSSVEILDLRPALRAAKTSGELLYSRTDTHWNDHGAYVAYREIAGLLQSWYPTMPPPRALAPSVPSPRGPGAEISG
jgi:hypothetical protein